MKQRSKLLVFGSIGTTLYLAGIGGIMYSNWSDFVVLKPNEWGDFLAGTVGPLALGWVVLSFILQSRELQNSVDALYQPARAMTHGPNCAFRLIV